MIRYIAFLRAINVGGRAIVKMTEMNRAFGIRNREVFIVSRRQTNGMYGFPNNSIEKEFGVPATTRNWSTVRKIVDLADEPS